jgi:hypothetical protein
MDENLEDFVVSSDRRGKRPETNAHFEALKRASCSATT